MYKTLLSIFFGFLIGFSATHISLSTSLLKTPGAESYTRIVVSETPSSTPTPTTSPLIEMPVVDSEKSSPSGDIFGIGQFCGGTQDTLCPKGLLCKKDGSGREASGFCVKP